MPRIEIYLTAACPYCTRAVDLLRRKGVDYTEIRVDGHPHQREQMHQRSKRFTVPQIFIDDRHIGGYDDLAALDCAGELDPLLRR